MVATLHIPGPCLDGPASSIIETSLNLRTTAFIFLNFQISRLDLLPRELAHAILLSTFALRDSLDLRQQRPVIVHVVSLSTCDPIAFPPSMAPREGELVIAKPGLSAFHRTGLERHLREHRVETVYICGVSSGAEMAATALAARDLLGERVWIIEDAYVETDHDGFGATIDLLAGLDMLTDVALIEGLKEHVEEAHDDASAIRREVERRERKSEEQARKAALHENDGLARHPAIVRSPMAADFGEKPVSKGALLKTRASASRLRA